MRLNQLLDERTQPVLEAINARGYRVRLVTSNDESWTCMHSRANKKFFDIGTSPCTNPQAAFAHELLHVDCQTLGYKSPPTAVTLNDLDQDVLLDYKGHFDNEFQHWKFYEKFLKMGFQAAEFFNDQDHDSFEEDILTFCSRLESVKATPLEFIDIALKFSATVIPVGSIADERRLELEQKFYVLRSGKYKSSLLRFRGILEAWATSSSYDSQPLIRDVFSILGLERTWFSYEAFGDGLPANAFPMRGFFVATPFTFGEVIKKFNARKR